MKWIGRGEKSFLYDIVANKRNGIDVDKFDYFARDCHVLGLTKSFDSLRLMRFARVHRVQRKATMTPSTSISHDLAMLEDMPDIASPSVVEEQGCLEVCYHVKEAWNIFELFHTRYTLHKRAYQHRVAGAIDHMICEALVLANPFFTIPGTAGQPKKMSECPYDYEAYWKLGEYIVRVIENSTDEVSCP
jgi:deoxynucleoside triphosphate triphosphohydrolase SAMHD1